MTIYELHRCRIGGEITANTPTCVIVEVARSFGVYTELSRADALISISSSIAPTISWSGDEGGKGEIATLRAIAGFVNGSSTLMWSIDTLKAAFEHLLTHYNDCPPLPVEFVAGKKTPLTPLAYDACMLYAQCKRAGIEVTATTTEAEMAAALRSKLSGAEEIRANLFDILQEMSVSELISLRLRLPKRPAIRTSGHSQSGVDDCVRSLQVPATILRRIWPRSVDEAIALAALNFNINISESKFPFDEYRVLATTATTNTTTTTTATTTATAFATASTTATATAVDPEWRERLQKCPDWYNVRLTWTPIVRRIYSRVELEMFLVGEGYSMGSSWSPRSPGSLYREDELLYMTRITPTFYAGHHPYCTETETAILAQPTGTGAGAGTWITTFGVVSEPHTLKLYSDEELAKHFENCLDYCNPADIRERLSQPAIAKLRSIASPLLLLAMARVDARLSTLGRHCTELCRTFKEGDAATREAVLAFLEALLHMAYYMRGWTGKGEPPLTRESTLTLPGADSEAQLIDRVNMAIHHFDDIILKLPESVRSVCSRLPQMRVKVAPNGAITFTPTSSPSAVEGHAGDTLLARLALVKNPEDDNACIRMASNIFAASAYYYTVALEAPPPFDIRRMSEIV
jgi:hypothetical protein